MNTDNTNDKEKESADNASSISSDLIRGHINTIILRTLYDGDKYGYEIINEIEEKSKGQYSLKQPTLYSALKRLESQDYVTSYWGGASNGGRRKYFQITDKGKAVVEQNRAEWEYSRTVIDSLISERDYDFSNPPPTSSVDFNILKKSTSRVPISYSDESDDIELPDGHRYREIGKDEDDEELAVSAQETSEDSDNTISSEQEEVVNVSGSDTEITENNSTENTTYSSQSQSVQEQSDQADTYTQSSMDQTQAGTTSSYEQNTVLQEENQSYQNAAQSSNYSSSVSQTITPDDHEENQPKAAPEPQPLTDDEKNRIHENYKALIGEETDATSYYYAQVARDKAQEPKQEEPVQDFAPDPYANGAQPYPPQDAYADPYAQGQFADPYAQGQYDDPYAQQNYSDPYSENRAISSELLYSNKSPAERNYKKLLNKLYDNTHKQQDEEDDFGASAYLQDQPEFSSQTQDVQQPESPAPQTYAAQPAYTEQPKPAAQPAAAEVPHAGNTASNIEFYDVEEKAQNEGLRITTTNGSRNRTMAKAVGNTFDKGRALLLTAIYVFIVALAECIINHCLHNVLNSGAAYIVIPYVLAFVMLGVFLFLFLNGYGKNSRKTQSKSYLSASLVIFINIVLIIVLIAYLVIYFGSADLSTGIQILKYAIFPIIYAFNLPLFALLYRVNSNKQ